MSRWILRAALIFCGLAMLSAAALLFFRLELADSSVLVFFLWLTIATFVVFATLLGIGTWRKWRKERHRSFEGNQEP